MKFSFHPAALKEYMDAVRFYAQINPVLAKSFIQSILVFE